MDGQGGEYYYHRCDCLWNGRDHQKSDLLLQMLLLNFSDGVGGVGGTWTTTTTTTCYFCLYYCKSIRLDLRRMGTLAFVVVDRQC
jgi:hypothetical protein